MQLRRCFSVAEIRNYARLWIHRPGFDVWFILSPPLVCLLLLLLFPSFIDSNYGLSTTSWVVLVLMIDVGHVYSTLYRTYFDRQHLINHRTLLLAAPAISFVSAFGLHFISPQKFWTVLAYLAVWHFVRQQYGFLKLYSRKLNEPRWKIYLQEAAIYAATLYPILFWHLSGDRTFHWFVENDFLLQSAPHWIPPLKMLYIAILGSYLLSELLFRNGQPIHFPRLLLVAGTALSWYVGIVALNHDLSFTLLNVVSHGIPYIALVAVKSRSLQKSKNIRIKWIILIGYLLSLWAFAYLEEGLWDGWIWEEHSTIFPIFKALSHPQQHYLLSLIIALLSLPQITHYILDGYIWRRNYEVKESIAST